MTAEWAFLLGGRGDIAKPKRTRSEGFERKPPLAHLLDARLLKPETIKLLWKPLQLESGEATGYGLGWLTKIGGRTAVASPGSSVGGMTAFVILPEQRMVISVMSNVTRAEVLPLWQALARLFLGDGA